MGTSNYSDEFKQDAVQRQMSSSLMMNIRNNDPRRDNMNVF